jgi:hypothetical protein
MRHLATDYRLGSAELAPEDLREEDRVPGWCRVLPRAVGPPRRVTAAADGSSPDPVSAVRVAAG